MLETKWPLSVTGTDAYLFLPTMWFIFKRSEAKAH